METTLKMKNPAFAEPALKSRPDIPRVLLAAMLAALLAAISVGKLATIHLPKPDLLPASAPATAPVSALARSEARHHPSPARTSRAQDARHAKFRESALEGPRMLACRAELEARRFRFRKNSPFPACTEAFATAPGCSGLKREFLEALYLYAYAHAAAEPATAASLLREALPLLESCERGMPLRQRAFELERELRSRVKPKFR